MKLHELKELKSRFQLMLSEMEWEPHPDEDDWGDDDEDMEGGELPPGKSGYQPTYWNDKGKYQKEYGELWDKLVPASGEAETVHGERLRAISRVYYERYNNGFGNDKTDEYQTLKQSASVIKPFMEDPAAYDKFLYALEYAASGDNGMVGMSGWEGDEALDKVVDGVIAYCLSVENKGEE